MHVLYNITKETGKRHDPRRGNSSGQQKTATRSDRSGVKQDFCRELTAPACSKEDRLRCFPYATLAPGSEAQTIDGITEQTEKRYMHHYNFPRYSSRRSRKTSQSPGRREIGHGALAERALIPVTSAVLKNSRMRSVWYRKSYPPTARLPWARPAAPAWR